MNCGHFTGLKKLLVRCVDYTENVVIPWDLLYLFPRYQNGLIFWADQQTEKLQERSDYKGIYDIWLKESDLLVAVKYANLFHKDAPDKEFKPMWDNLHLMKRLIEVFHYTRSTVLLYHIGVKMRLNSWRKNRIAFIFDMPDEHKLVKFFCAFKSFCFKS